MKQNVTLFRIMIASPGDVKKERQEVINAIHLWNANNSERESVILQPLTWEIDVSRGEAEDGQKLIDTQILQRSDLVVGIFWKKLGRKSSAAISYTVGELKDHINSGKQAVIFFKDPPKSKNKEELDSIRAVIYFKENLKAEFGVDSIYSEFRSLNDFNIYAKLEKDVSVHLLPKVQKGNDVDSTRPIFRPITFFNQNERPKKTQFFETIKDAKKFYFMARTGVTFLTRYALAIMQAIEKGCECRFIILSKDSDIIKRGRFETAFDEKNASHALEYLAMIKKKYPEKVEIHLCDYYPTFDIEYFENTKGEKKLVIQTHFIASHLGPDRPMFMLCEGDFWYSIFWDELTQIWSQTSEWRESDENSD